MEVYTVHVDYHNEKAKAATRIVKRKVLKAGAKFLELSAQYRPGPKARVTIDECFTSLEAAQAGLAILVTRHIALLQARIDELRAAPQVRNSWIFEVPAQNSADLSEEEHKESKLKL